MTKRYYAAQSPRGFSNEIIIYSFSSLSKRNAWVAEHEHDGDVNSAYCGAYVVSRAKAMQIAGPAVDRAGWPDRSRVDATFIA